MSADRAGLLSRLGNYEAIENIMKSWIPHTTITAPKEFRESFLAEVKGWVLKQEKGYNPHRTLIRTSRRIITDK